jgi:hypothetical protein
VHSNNVHERPVHLDTKQLFSNGKPANPTKMKNNLNIVPGILGKTPF